MASTYACQNPRRRAFLTGTQIVGIDYVTVWDGDVATLSLSDQWRQRVVDVHLLNPPSQPSLEALLPTNVQITGGERIRDVVVDAIAVENEGGTSFLRLSLNQPGDFSTYTLRIVAGLGSDQAPEGWDPILSSIALSFKADCPTDLDCTPLPAQRPAGRASPPLNYLAKDYEGLRQLMLDRLSVLIPGWEESGPTDLTIALVEAMAYAADHLSYYQDAVATEAYLGTARRRVSARRHARLLDYPMHDGVSARVWLQVQAAVPTTLPSGTQVLSGLSGIPKRIAPASETHSLALSREPVVFETCHDAELDPLLNELRFYTWGDASCCLPEGATSATLLDPLFTHTDAQLHTDLKIGSVLIFEEVKGTQTGLQADADPARRHAVRLIDVEWDEDPLGGFILEYGPPVTRLLRITWSHEDALPFALPLSIRLNGALIEDVAVARGNVVLADHGRAIDAESLGPVPVGEVFRPRLAERGLAHTVPWDQATGAARSARWAMSLDPRAALPAMELVQGPYAYALLRDLLGSTRFSRAAVAELEGDGRAYLRFGDGTHGLRPPGGATFTATYRVGSGLAGNVGADALSHVVSVDNALLSVRNPMAAVGGADAEPLEEVRLYAPTAMRRQMRAVTPGDYVEIAERHPDVQRAVARRHWTGSWSTIVLSIDRRGGLPVDDAFTADLVAFMEPYRLARQELKIEAPSFVPLDLAFSICVAPSASQGTVRRRLLQVFSSRTGPDRQPAWFHPDRFTFGQPVFLSPIVARIMGITGVLSVDTSANGTRFRRWGRADEGELSAGFIPIDPTEIARLDNDPNAAENGRLVFNLEGGR